jgi:hypothetical protein
MKGSSSVSGNTGGGIFLHGGVLLVMSGSSSVSANTSENEGAGIKNNGVIILKGSASVFDNTTTSTGGGIYNNTGTTSACDATSVDEWIGTVEPNDPNDFLDRDVTLIPSGTDGCA